MKIVSLRYFVAATDSELSISKYLGAYTRWEQSEPGKAERRQRVIDQLTDEGEAMNEITRAQNLCRAYERDQKRSCPLAITVLKLAGGQRKRRRGASVLKLVP